MKTKTTYDDFLYLVKEIERTFTDKMCESLGVRFVWVTDLLGDVDNILAKTTVSDYKSVYGSVNLCFLARARSMENLHIIRLREPKKNEFRGTIKFAPKGTLSFSQYCSSPLGGGDGKWVNVGVPVYQREDYLNIECDAAFANKGGKKAYEEIMNNAWLFLELDKRFCAYPQKYMPRPGKQTVEEESFILQNAISIAGNIHDFYGVVYEWHGIDFIFPMHREDMKVVFKNRDKINGRRSIMPTLVREHTRKETTVESFLRFGENYFTQDGREYYYYIGSEDFEAVMGSDRQKDRMIDKFMDSSRFVGIDEIHQSFSSLDRLKELKTV